MKLLHFCNLYPNKLGAYEHVLAAIGREFKEHGDELVMVFAAEPTPDVAELLRAQSVRWHVIDGWSDGRGAEHPWRVCLPGLRLLKQERPDVAAVHFGNELPSVALIALSKLREPRRVRWVWEQDQQIQPPGRLSARLSKIRLASWFFDRMLAVYDGGRESFLARGVPSEMIEVIHNSVRDYHARNEDGWLRKERSVSAGTTLVLCTSWLVPRKRVDYVLRAFARASNGTTAVLLLVGDGPCRSDLEELAGELGVGAQVHFLGRRNDVLEILQEVDILAHASEAEGCPYAISESLCAGVPAVVCDAGATSEQVLDGKSGFVVPRDDFEGFCSGISRLLREPELRTCMGAAARQRWGKRYRLKDAARQYHAMYGQLASSARQKDG